MDNVLQFGLVTFINFVENYGYINTWDKRYYFQRSELGYLSSGAGVVVFRVRPSLVTGHKEEAYQIKSVYSYRDEIKDNHHFLLDFADEERLKKYILNNIEDELKYLFSIQQYVNTFKPDDILKVYKITLVASTSYVRDGRYNAAIRFCSDKDIFKLIESDKYIYDLLYYDELIWQDDADEAMLEAQKKELNFSKLKLEEDKKTSSVVENFKRSYNKKEHAAELFEQSKNKLVIDLGDVLHNDLSLLMSRYAMNGIYLGSENDDNDLQKFPDDDDFWHCDICQGNYSTGCLYFDPTECPRQ